jgi:predicted nuclease with TOPRIM domain
MYGPDEHRYFCTELGRVNAELDDLRERLALLRVELADDDATARKSLGDLATARMRVASAAGHVELAVTHLPTPVAR